MTNAIPSHISYADDLEHWSTNHDLKGVNAEQWKDCKMMLQKETGHQQTQNQIYALLSQEQASPSLQSKHQWLWTGTGAMMCLSIILEEKLSFGHINHIWLKRPYTLLPFCTRIHQWKYASLYICLRSGHTLNGPVISIVQAWEQS